LLSKQTGCQAARPAGRQPNENALNE